MPYEGHTLANQMAGSGGLLPTGCEERGVLRVENIPVAILLSGQDM